MDQPIIILGDFNCIPNSLVYILLSKDFKSAMKEIHGSEPAVTWPTELLGSKDVWGQYGEAECYDYIWYKNIDLKDASLVNHIREANICPSDHYPIEALFSIDNK